MPYFVCNKCKREINYSEKDESLFEELQWRCLQCWTIIGEKKYPVNIENSTTVFTAIGDGKLGAGLGDRILFEVVRRKYIEDNPDENVIFLKVDDDHEKISSFYPTKIFLNEFYREDTGRLNNKAVIRYKMINEVCYFAEHGIYPRTMYELVRPNVELPEKYMVVHLRNIEKKPDDKNVSMEIATKIMRLLNGSQHNIVLVGNDNRFREETWENDNVLDLRNKLSLEEISWIIKNAMLYIGRDSGLVHLAATCGTRIVSWGFISDEWFPKMPSNKFAALLNRDSNWDNIGNVIKNTTNHYKGSMVLKNQFQI